MSQKSRNYSRIECDWASLGAAFSVPKDSLHSDVDPESLVCEIIASIPSNPRYAPIFVIWIRKFRELLDFQRLHDMFSLLPPESERLYWALAEHDEQCVEFDGQDNVIKQIVMRAHDPRLLPLAESKVKPFDRVVAFNRVFSSRLRSIESGFIRASFEGTRSPYYSSHLKKDSFVKIA